MIRFRKLEPYDLGMVGKWREKPRINAVMASQVKYNYFSQLDWYNRLFNSGYDGLNWIILDDLRPVGLINLQDFKPAIGESSWGFYIGEDDYKMGAMIPPYLYNHLFFKYRNMHTIKAQVMFHNKRVIKLHLSHGYTIDGLENDTLHMRLSKSSWSCQNRWHGLQMIII